MFFTPVIPSFKSRELRVSVSSAPPANISDPKGVSSNSEIGTSRSASPLFTVTKRRRRERTGRDSLSAPDLERESTPSDSHSLTPDSRSLTPIDLEPLEKVFSQASRCGVVDLSALAAAVNETFSAAGLKARLSPTQPGLCLALSDSASGSLSSASTLAENDWQRLKEMEEEEIFSLLLHLDSLEARDVPRSLQRRLIEEMASRQEKNSPLGQAEPKLHV